MMTRRQALKTAGLAATACAIGFSPTGCEDPEPARRGKHLKRAIHAAAAPLCLRCAGTEH